MLATDWQNKTTMWPSHTCI